MVAVSRTRCQAPLDEPELTSLSMNRVLTAPAAELLQLEPVLGVRLVLGGDVVATFALGAGHRQRRSLVRRHSGLASLAVPSTLYLVPGLVQMPSIWHQVRITEWVPHLVILMTRPAPTVRPPSRMANRSPSSMAIGAINSTVISVLSPGITI